MDGGRVALEVSATIGRRIRLAAGATGKVFLAYRSELERTEYLAQRTHPTIRTIIGPAQYASELEQMRRMSYATDDEECPGGVRATAAPVFDARGRVAAAVLVVGLVASLPVADLPRIGEATARTARSIPSAIGAPDFLVQFCLVLKLLPR
jgi:DNA-binding IclR family transcriptional regulator